MLSTGQVRPQSPPTVKPSLLHRWRRRETTRDKGGAGGIREGGLANKEHVSTCLFLREKTPDSFSCFFFFLLVCLSGLEFARPSMEAFLCVPSAFQSALWVL